MKGKEKTLGTAPKEEVKKIANTNRDKSKQRIDLDQQLNPDYLIVCATGYQIREEPGIDQLLSGYRSHLTRLI